MRRVRVGERTAGAVAIAFGLTSSFAGPSPTGSTIVDGIVMTASVAAVAWIAASAPWWVLALAASVATLAGFGVVPIALGLLGAALAFAIGVTRADVSVLRTASAGCSLLALSHLGLGGPFGSSTIVATSCAAALIGFGLARRKRATVRRIGRVSVGLAAMVLLFSIGAGASLLQARSDLVEGREFLASGLDHLRDGDAVDASEDFQRATKAFGAAESSMGRPWAQGGRLIPVVAQHRRAGTVAATAGHRASVDIGALSAVLDVDLLRPSAGRFDIDAIETLREPMATARATLLDVGEQIDSARSPWLIASVAEQLQSAEEEFDANIGTVESLADAVDRAPALLGADGVRRYFVAFTTPAEARGTGGFMGNFAVLTADRGLVTLSDFGRTLDLNRGFGERTVEAPDDWLRRWGRYGFTNGPGDTTGPEPWSNITISPHFPSTASVIASLFPQSGGAALDGVIAIDPYVLQAFVGFTGPITVESGQTRLTRNNTAEFLLFDQYAIDQDERVDALEQVATETMSALLDGALPDPAVLADQLGPLIEAERLVAWMADPADQRVFEAVGMTGALPRLDGNTDGFSVVINNAGANKLDAFLARDFEYLAEYDTASPLETFVDGQLTIMLTNSAPTSGLPDGVIGNYVGEDIGTNRSLITLYTAAPVEAVTANGSAVTKEPGIEAGWNTTTFVVTTPADASTEIVVRISGPLREIDGERGPHADAADGPGLVVRTQPLVDTPTYRIATRTVGGVSVVEHTEAVIGTERLTRP